MLLKLLRLAGFSGTAKKSADPPKPASRSAEPRPAEQAPLQLIDTRHGKFIVCNPLETIQASLIAYGAFEYHSIVLARELLRLKQGDVVDVGANIGVFSVPVAIAFRDRIVHAFEPQPNVFTHLCANLIVNRLLNVRPSNVAIGVSRPNQEIEVPDFDIFQERYTGSVTLDAAVAAQRSRIQGVAEPATWARRFSTVRIVQLDDVLRDTPVAFIKVDVEGMELSVLQSAGKIIERDRPILYFESWELPQFAESNEVLMQFVFSRNYSVWKIGNDCLAVHRDDAPTIERVKQTVKYEDPPP